MPISGWRMLRSATIVLGLFVRWSVNLKTTCWHWFYISTIHIDASHGLTKSHCRFRFRNGLAGYGFDRLVYTIVIPLVVVQNIFFGGVEFFPFLLFFLSEDGKTFDVKTIIYFIRILRQERLYGLTQQSPSSTLWTCLNLMFSEFVWKLC